jgi:hypothetical protein
MVWGQESGAKTAQSKKAMYYRKNDVLPTEESVTLNPIYTTPSIAQKLRGNLRHQQEQCFNQTEVALLVHVTHQRISALLKHISAKAVKIL